MIDSDKYSPLVGDYVAPDGWSGHGSNLERDNTVADSGWPGCAFRLESWHGHKFGVNVVCTGQPHYVRHGDGRYRSRCKIEFVGDCEPSEFTGGWIYHKF